MFFGRRIGLLVMGLCGSVVVGLLLFANCVNAVSAPVVARMTMSFPSLVEGTPLLVQSITGYEGPYVEDGTDEEVADVAALVLYNTGEELITAAEVTVQCEENTFCFTLNDLPGDSAVVVLERNGQPWIPQSVYRCTASLESDQADGIVDRLRVRQTDTCILEIANLTDEIIQDITISHKTWSKEIGCYLGGIAYKTYIDSLQPGQILLLSPDHYAVESSRIVNISSS